MFGSAKARDNNRGNTTDEHGCTRMAATNLYRVSQSCYNARVKMPSERRPEAAVEILHRRYVGDDPARKAALETARLHAEVARTIYDLRTQAGLTQQELARLVGTTQSVISRLEDEEYKGHSLEMLHRIAVALNKRMTFVMTSEEAKAGMR